MPGDSIALAVIAVSILAGVAMYAHFGGATSSLADGVALVGKVAWVLAGVGLILGGMQVIGGLLIVLGVAIGLGRADNLSDRNIRKKLNG